MSELTTSAVTVLMAIIGLAIIAVLVSKNANTSGVLSSGGGAISGLISSATGPITGGGFGGFTGGIPSLGVTNG